MKTDWFKDVNPGLDRLTKILGMGKPSHGYTIAEEAPEVVTAPGVFFPAKKGEVIPLEARKEGGSVSPTESGDKEHRKLSIIESIVSMMKPMHLESRALGGLVVPPEPMKLEQSKYDILKSALSVLKPQGQQKLTSAEKGSSGTPKPSGTKEEPSLPKVPSLPKPPSSMMNLPTSQSFSIQPDATRGSDVIDLSENKEGTFDIPTIPRQAGGTVWPPTPESLELEERKKWAQTGYPEKRLAEARETLGPSIFSVSPGFEHTYYEAHPEEKLMDYITEQNKPVTDMYTKLIEEARTRQQGYGRGFGPTPLQRRFGAKESEYGKNILELMKGLEKTMALPGETLGAVMKGGKTPTAPAPHLVQDVSGQYVWATPGGILPAGIMGKTPASKVPGAPHPRTTEGYTLVADPVTGLNTALSPTGKSEPYDPKKHGEQELPGVITDEDAKLYANMLVSNEMAPSQLRLVVQPFGQAGGLTKNKIFKMVKQLNPTYNLKLAEAEYAADTKALSNLSNIYATAQTAMGAAENHGKQILELSSKVDRTGSPALNRYFLVGKKQIAGDVDVNNLDIALHAFDREFARYLTSMTQGGVLAQSEAKAVENLLTSAKNPQQIIGGIQTIQKLMEGKKASFNDQFSRIKGSLGGTQENQPSGAAKVWKIKPDGTWAQE